MYKDQALEDVLIHFLMARKLAKKAQIPDSYRAKESREYLAILQGSESGPVTDCYGELCTLTHPAAPSFLWMLSIDAEGETVVSKRNPHPDAIADFCRITKLMEQADAQSAGQGT